MLPFPQEQERTWEGHTCMCDLCTVFYSQILLWSSWTLQHTNSYIQQYSYPVKHVKTKDLLLRYKIYDGHILCLINECWVIDRAGTIYRYIDNIDIWKADTRIDTIYEISIQGKNFRPYLFLLPFYYNYSILTNVNSPYPSGKPETVMFR